jgi:hypothetical protein
VVGALIGDRGVVPARPATGGGAAREPDALRETTFVWRDIAALRSDPRAVETIAREQLGLARPGETVFILREEPIASRP